jgi:peptidoglycan/xylan/chitin deacetylase (PgdA/CDA1 family)
MYFYDKKEDLLNREYIDYQNNIQVEYPYFNNQKIDSYISDYLNKVIDTKNDFRLFIDYDYVVKDQVIDLYIYTYKYKTNIINENIKNIEIDANKDYTIKENSNKTTNYYYDAYKQKIIDKNKPMIALTFDDGPSYNTGYVLDILEKYNVKATFFLLGVNINGNEEVIKRMSSLGMEIGNHMYSHKLGTRLGETKINSLVYNITNKYPTLVRPSYGSYNKKIKNLAKRPLIIWNIDTLDWKYHNSNKISNSILKKARDGDIVLMHDIYSATAKSLEITIPKLLKEGYQLVTVSDLFYYKEKNLDNGKVYHYCK